jgi:bifunctional non-homologous end joining protein LigD
MAKSAFPLWIEPMRATLTDDRFSSMDWLFEPKLDGERCLTFRNGKEIRLSSANRQPLNIPYPEIVAAVRAQKAGQFVLDGEVVAFTGSRTDFALLQQRMHINDPKLARSSPVKIFYYVFDLLFLNGKDLRASPLLERKALLQKNIKFIQPMVYMTHLSGNGEEYYAQACRQGWEGLIAKHENSRYAAGRSREWLKFKCVLEQEFVIGGYSDPEGARPGFGALLLGYYENKKLRYAGKVGTGYSQDTLDRLTRQLSQLQVPRAPFADADISPRGVHWVRPKLVAQIGFAEWTPEGKLRQGRFMGLRRDKAPEKVVRERPFLLNPQKFLKVRRPGRS